MKKILKKFASLRITVVILIAGLMLVLAGTLAQTHMPIREAQKIYFQSFVVSLHFKNGMTIPVLPGGYTLGIVMIVNLLCAYLTTFKWSFKRIGILIMHSGILMLLLSQLITDLYSVESQVILDHGQAKNYSESLYDYELALTDLSGKELDRVYSIPKNMVFTDNLIVDAKLPIALKIREFLPNADLRMGGNDIATEGFGKGVKVTPMPPVKGDTMRNLTSAYVDLIQNGKTMGTWLLSTAFIQPEKLVIDGKPFLMQLRFRRYMLPMTIKLLEFEHKKFTGTSVPKAFSSRLRLIDPIQHEDRTLTISMNQPLRYDGKTFYQSGFANEDQTTILQVVRNPAAPLPYIACILVTLGMTYHFITHFLKFFKQQIKRDTEVQA